MLGTRESSDTAEQLLRMEKWAPKPGFEDVREPGKCADFIQRRSLKYQVSHGDGTLRTPCPS